MHLQACEYEEGREREAHLLARDLARSKLVVQRSPVHQLDRQVHERRLVGGVSVKSFGFTGRRLPPTHTRSATANTHTPAQHPHTPAEQPATPGLRLSGMGLAGVQRAVQHMYGVYKCW